jgi:hypothetical protein
MTPEHKRLASERTLFRDRLVIAAVLGSLAAASAFAAFCSDDLPMYLPGAILVVCAWLMSRVALESGVYATDRDVRRVARAFRGFEEAIRNRLLLRGPRRIEGDDVLAPVVRADPEGANEDVKARLAGARGRNRLTATATIAASIMTVAMLSTLAGGARSIRNAVAALLAPQPTQNPVDAAAPQPSATQDGSAAIRCTAGEPFAIDEGANPMVGITASYFGFGMNALGYAVRERAKSVIFDESGGVQSRGDELPTLSFGSSISRVVPNSVAGMMVDALNISSSPGPRLRCGDVGSIESAVRPDVVPECRSFASDSARWVVATHVRPHAQGVVIEQTLDVAGMKPTVTLASKSIARRTSAAGDASTATSDAGDAADAAPRTVPVALEASDVAHFVAPESVRMGASYVVASLEGPEVWLVQAHGTDVLPAHWALAANGVPASLATDGINFLMVVAVDGEVMGTVFRPGVAPSKPMRIELGAPSIRVGRKLSVAGTAPDGPTFVAYVGALDHQIHVSVLGPQLGAHDAPALNIAAAEPRDLRVVALPGRRGALLFYVTSNSSVKAVIIDCTGSRGDP